MLVLAKELLLTNELLLISSMYYNYYEYTLITVNSFIHVAFHFY